MGGAVMGVYDVNGDGFGRCRDGSECVWMGIGVVRTEARCGRAQFADVNSDGIPDFIVGNRYLSRVNTYL